MSKQTQAIRDDMGQLAEDARALMAATADVAGERVEEARKRLAAARAPAEIVRRGFEEPGDEARAQVSPVLRQRIAHRRGFRGVEPGALEH